MSPPPQENKTSGSAWHQVLGTVLAFAAASVVTFSAEYVGHLLYPPPANIKLDDYESFAAYVHTMPAMALVLVIVGHAAGSAAGALVYGLYAKSKGMSPYQAWKFGVLYMLCGALNLYFIPHPTWFAVLDLCAYVPASTLVAFSINPLPVNHHQA